MSDTRRTAANGRVAATALRGRVTAGRFTDGAARQVLAPVADLVRAPGGQRMRQVVKGESLTVYETLDGWSFVQLGRDGYVGYLPDTALTEVEVSTHRVRTRSTHLYPEGDFKAHETCTLSHRTEVRVISQSGRFAETPHGFIPHAHLVEVGQLQTDPVAVSELYLGTPYLWGGNSGFGIDCSGLVQAACLTCGIPCPGDSDMQAGELGERLPEDAPLQRGDLLFWKGHVAWVADPETLLHANAFHMAVAYEPLQDAINRIKAQGDGPVTSRKRLGGRS